MSTERLTISVTSNGNIENNGFGEKMMKSLRFNHVEILHFAQIGNNDNSESGINYCVFN